MLIPLFETSSLRMNGPVTQYRLPHIVIPGRCSSGLKADGELEGA
jgi:hypothetical protein